VELQGLRALVRNTNFSLGVPATVTPPGGVAVNTRIIWAHLGSELQPNGNEFQRAEGKHIMALRRDEVPAAPRGTLVTARGPLTPPADPPSDWRVDATVDVFPDRHHVIVVAI